MKKVKIEVFFFLFFFTCAHNKWIFLNTFSIYQTGKLGQGMLKQFIDKPKSPEN